MEVNMEEILKKLNNLKENASKEEYDVKKLEIKYDSQEVKEIKDKMQYAFLGSYNREELKNEYDNKTSELENKEQEIKELADKMEKEFNDKKAETIDSINQEMSKYKKNKEIENLKSQRNAYSKMIENSKKNIQNILEAVNTGKDADFSRLRSARAEVAENTKAMERLDKEIDNCISLEDNKKAFSDLEYLKMRVSSYRVDELEKVANDSFLKEYGKENDNDKLLEEWEKAKNDRELEMWDEAIKENEEYDKKKFLQDWEDAIEENKEFDEIHRVESEPNPKPGTQPTAQPTTQPKAQQPTQPTVQPPTQTPRTSVQEKQPEILISDKPEVIYKNHITKIGGLRNILKQKPEVIVDKLKEILPNVDEEYIYEMQEKIDPVVLEGIVTLKNNNVILARDAKTLLGIIGGLDKNFENEAKKMMPVNITYDLDKISKGAFLPWNKKQREKIVKFATRSEKMGIANVKGEYEPNPFKRMVNKMVNKAKTKKLESPEKENTVNKKENKFKNEIMESAKLNDYDKIKNSIENAKSIEEIEEIENNAVELTRAGKISKEELGGIMYQMDLKTKGIENSEQPKENKEQDDKEID